MAASSTGITESNIPETSEEILPRLVMIAYCFDPDGTMEERNGWHRALIAAEQFDTTVIYRPLPGRGSFASKLRELPISKRLRTIELSPSRLTNFLLNRELTFYRGYRRWHSEAFAVAQKLHSNVAFDLAHTATLCGFREPGVLWKLGVPHVWGPIGGTQDLPIDFYSMISPAGKLREWLRSKLNWWHLKHRKRVRDAFAGSAAVIAATEKARDDFMVHLGVDVEVDLETGLDYETHAKESIRDHGQPLKILWSGRLREWKGLPLLLYALAKLRSDRIPFELRVLGAGSSKARWMKLAKRLKIEQQIEWIESSGYRIGFEHYRWADVFAFTSLRDTSGTGLLDALAAGTPIVGVGHQGASDIITPDCGVVVSVERPSQTISEMAAGLSTMARNPKRLRELSLGATRRAKYYHWDQRRNFWFQVYSRVLPNHRNQQIACS